MKNLITLGIFAFALLPGVTKASEERIPQYRVDCRFYSEDSKFCYASAIYNIYQNELKNIRYGVGCNYETIYNDKGVSTPISTVSDGLRPRTAALPRVEIIPQDSLKHPGTYTSRLEISSGKITDGVCYVNESNDSPYATPILFE